MYKTITLATIVSLISLTLSGQENYVNATITYKSGQIEKGYIDYQDWKFNPEIILFKKYQDSDVTKYGVDDLSSFEVANQKYIWAEIQKEISGDNITSINFDRNPQLESDFVFIKQIVDGNKPIYSYKEKNFPKGNFYLLNDGQYELLVYKKFFVNKDGDKFIKENNSYLSALSKYLNDCNRLSNTISKTKYNESDLQRLIIEYNDCSQANLSSTPIIQEGKKRKIGVIAGPEIHTLSYTGTAQPELSDGKFDLRLGYSLGLFIDLITSARRGKNSLTTEILFNKFNNSGFYSNYQDEDRSEESTLEINMNYLKSNTLYRTRLLKKSNNIFFDLGLSIGYGFFQLNENNTVKKFFVDTTMIQKPAIKAPKGLEIGLLLGSGIEFEKFGLEARFELGNGNEGGFGLAGKSYRFSLLGTYSI